MSKDHGYPDINESKAFDSRGVRGNISLASGMVITQEEAESRIRKAMKLKFKKL